MWTDALERHTMLWDADEIEMMGEMIFQGKSISEIAKRLNRTQEAVSCKARTLDMLPKRVRRKVSGSAGAMSF